METVKEEDFFQKIFQDARDKGSVNYIYTLVRVEGTAYGVLDPFLRILENLKSTPLGDAEIAVPYQALADEESPLHLLYNLISCASGKEYNLYPFSHLITGVYPDLVRPTHARKIKELKRYAIESQRPYIAERLEAAYPEHLPDPESVRVAFAALTDFLGNFIGGYFEKRLGFKSQTQRIYKLPQFEVLELLINDDRGLFGFHVHFSNGNSATFTRTDDSTSAMNVSPQQDGTVNFMVGMLDELKPEWRIKDKRLYEIGLPGRYNERGKWKPIVYPGDAHNLQKDAMKMSEDSDVQGVLFYMMCTGHRVIEFVLRANIELPKDYIGFGTTFHLLKCKTNEETEDAGRNIRIYDGWLELEAVDPEAVRHGLQSIAAAVNRLAFAYGVNATWRLKYNISAGMSGCAKPSEKDLELLDSVLRRFPDGEDSGYLEASIDWFNKGSSSANVFTKFFCYYVAMESIALAVADGKANLGLGYIKQEESARQKEMTVAIQKLHDALYLKDPVGFVESAYLKCFEGIKKKTEKIAELVFGPEHKFLDVLFKQGTVKSLSQIRGMLAHGKVTLIDHEHEKLVASRVHQIAHISREFLMRVLFKLKPEEPTPKWSTLHSISCSASDPRGTLLVTKEEMLAGNNWDIKPEWCE